MKRWIQCELNDIFKQNDIEEILIAFAKTICGAFIQMLGHSYVSMIGTLVLAILAISFVPVKVSQFKRIIIGLLHVIAHLVSAMTLMLLLEIGIETCVRYNHLGTSGMVFFNKKKHASRFIYTYINHSFKY